MYMYVYESFFVCVYVYVLYDGCVVMIATKQYRGVQILKYWSTDN